jgi:hypothetical protein
MLQIAIPAGQSYTTDLNLGPYVNASVLKAIRVRITDAQLIEQ